MSDDRRYKPPHLAVPLKGGEQEAPLLFRKVNVELTPQPQVMHFELHGSGGDLTCTYDPAPLIGEIINFYAWLLCPPVAVVSEYMEKLACGTRTAKRYLAELYCDRMRMCVSTACNYAREQAEEYFVHTLRALYDDSVNRTFAVRNEQAFKVVPVEGLIRDSLKEYRTRQRKLVNLPTRGGSKNAKYDWTDEKCLRLANFHASWHQQCKTAKKVYKEHPNDYRRELENMLLLFSETTLDLLTDPDPYRSSPTNLALVEAALGIGLEPSAYSIRQLRYYLARGRSLRRTGAGGESWKVKVWL